MEQVKVGKYRLIEMEGRMDDVESFRRFKGMLTKTIIDGERFLALDMTRLEFVFSELVNHLAQLKKKMDDPGELAIALIAPGPVLEKLLRDSMLDSVLEVYPNRTEFEKAAQS